MIEKKLQMKINWNIINLIYTHFNATKEKKGKWLILHDTSEIPEYLSSDENDIERSHSL